MTAPVPERWVEMASRAAFDARVSEPDQSATTWEELPDSWRQEWLDSADSAITPVLADLRQQVQAMETRCLIPLEDGGVIWVAREALEEFKEQVLAVLDGGQ